MPTLYQFGPFQLDSSGHLLLRDGKPVSLTPKALDTLLVLVQASGRVLQKDEILTKVWPDTFIEEATLAQNIFTLRKILGVDENGRPYIETIPRRGYRFVADVKKLGPRGVAPEAKPAGDASEEVAPAPPPGPDAPAKSLAVMPLINLSPDQDIEYLAEGITDSIINNLAHVPQLHVIASSIVLRSMGHEIDPVEVGRELGVHSVLLGQVMKLGERLDISMKLIDVAHGWHTWGQQYNRALADIFEVQEDIFRNVCDKLQLSHAEGWRGSLAKLYTPNAEAYRLYLMGRYYWNKRTGEGYRRAIASFREAIEGDPNYALAYTGLADAYSLQCSAFYAFKQPTENMPRARAAVMKALRINDTLPEAHTSLAYIKLAYDWDWVGAEAEFKRAITLDPRNAHARHWYSHYLIAMGKNQAALEENKKAMELEPGDLAYNQHLGWYFLATGDSDKAVETLRRLVDQYPSFYPARVILGIAYQQKEMFPEALAEFQDARRLEDTAPTLAFIGNVYGLSGEKKKAREMLGELEKRSRQQYVSAYCKAVVEIGLEEYDAAFKYLDDAYHERSEWLMWIKVNGMLDPLRSDPRYDRLVQQLGFPGSGQA
ncbi:MAG: winged helix-turn-helix domain-containing protein [Acidobacteriota bacterium]|nr:winged helix-turn-helix domain-containing protein [Acidobacteriota bacterium]